MVLNILLEFAVVISFDTLMSSQFPLIFNVSLYGFFASHSYGNSILVITHSNHPNLRWQLVEKCIFNQSNWL